MTGAWSKLRQGALLITAILMWGTVLAQKPARNQALEIRVDEQEPFYRFENMRVSKETGAPLALYRVNYLVKSGSPEEMARQYLRENARLLHLRPDLDDLRHTVTRETPGGYHVRFQQYIEGYPVYHGNIVVNIDRHDMVVFVMNSYKPRAKLMNTRPVISLEQAEQIAKNYLNIQGRIHYQAKETVVYYHRGRTRLAHKITLVPAEDLFGDWEVLVDAVTGEIFKVTDRALYAPRSPRRTTGSGWVFDPDPLTRARALYQAGGPFGDNNDADTDSLVAQIVERPLLDITFDGSMYHLEGPYADIVDIEAPFEGEFSRSDSLWQFTRNPQEFEAANVYFHVDKSMRYINEVLGFSVMPFQYSGGVQGDPHGLGGSDNSHYIPTTGQLAWGEGGVDDSEDPDVILHELGHGIHDWITNGNLSQVHGLSEGSGDYWAASYNRSLGFWTPADPQYFWVFQWDGHNEFWPGRITNYTATFPGGLTGQIHTDGQMWSSTLMQIWDDIGREATDSDFLEALSMTNANSGQDDAAQAFVQADINLYGGAHLWSIEQWFTQRGYPITIPVPQIAHDPLPDTEDLTGPYTVTATINSAFPLAEVKLIYGTDGAFTDTTDMAPNGNQYTADIPGTGVPTHYNYYIFAADTAGLASTHPPGAPQNYHAFYAGPDTVPPVIQHSPLGDQALMTWPAQVEAHIFDNLGIASAVVEYSLNDSLTGSFSLTNITGDLYQGVFDIDSSALSIGDTIAYRIIATDASSAGNQTVDPPTGFHRFAIVDILGRILIIDDDPATGKTSGITEKGTFRRQLSKQRFGASADQMARWLSDMSYLVTVEDVNNTDPNQWDEYDLLISSSGFNFDPVSDATYRTALETYVGDTTHKLLVEGGEVGYDATSFPGYPTFAANVLHSDDWDADNAGPLNLMSGYANHPMVTTPNQLPSQMQIIYTDWPSEDAVTAVGGAYVVYEPQSYPGDAGISIYDNNQDPRSAQIVFFAFNFAELADSNVARDLLENAVKYLLTPEGTPGGNAAPSTFHLLLPADGDTVANAQAIEFRWTAAQDPDGDSLLYHLEIFNDSLTVAVDSIGDTTYVFDGSALAPNTAYQWTASVTDGQLVTASSDTFTFVTLVRVGIDPKRPGIPAQFALHANFPNPFNPTTTIRYDLKEAVRVRLRIFNLLGQVVRTLVDGRENAGYKQVVWDGRNDAGRPVASGVYLYRLEAGNPSAGSGHGFVKTRKMILIR